MLNQVLGLISLPRLADDTAITATALVVLAAFVVGARSVRAYGDLRRRVAAVSARADGLAAREETLAESLAELRARAMALDVVVEGTLWALPRFDERVAELEQTLADNRRSLANMRGDDDEPIRRTIEGIRGTLTFLRSASDLRRKLRA